MARTKRLFLGVVALLVAVCSFAAPARADEAVYEFGVLPRSRRRSSPSSGCRSSTG